MELTYAELSSPGPARDNNEDYVGFWQPQTLEEKRSRGSRRRAGRRRGRAGSRRGRQPSGGRDLSEDLPRGPRGEDPAAAPDPDVQCRQPGGLRQGDGEPRQVPHGDDPLHRRACATTKSSSATWATRASIWSGRGRSGSSPPIIPTSACSRNSG